MKQKMLIFLVLIVLVLILLGLNAATYVQKEKVPDTEFAPNRSSYNFGSTGTHAFFTLLSESGRNVRRWQEPLDTISTQGSGRPSVFVMVGPLRRELTDVEHTQLMKWVSDGGTLILIDREPPSDLVRTTTDWHMTVRPSEGDNLLGIDTSDQVQMTAQTPALKPALPSSFTHGVTAIQQSRFASSVSIERSKGARKSTSGYQRISPPPPPPPAASPSPTPFDFYGSGDTSSAEAESDSEAYTAETDEAETDAEVPAVAAFEAPVVHVGDASKGFVVEAPYGGGRVVLLSDPYIVSNAGIGIVDNSRLAINLATSRAGIIAFDEYHHGYGANNNRFFQYFEGTPVMAIFLQIAIILGFVFFSQSRRFARAVPEPEPSRLSKLEYVSAMAELQQRTRAYDLAIENIYSDFRRRVCALLGLDNMTANRRDIAALAAERIGGDARAIEQLLFRCEDTIQGEPIGKNETVELVEGLRRLEEELGLKRARRKGV